MEAEEVGHHVTECHCGQMAPSSWTTQVGANSALAAVARYTNTGRRVKALSSVSHQEGQDPTAPAGEHWDLVPQGRKNKEKGKCLLLPPLPTDRLMLVDCRRPVHSDTADGVQAFYQGQGALVSGTWLRMSKALKSKQHRQLQSMKREAAKHPACKGCRCAPGPASRRERDDSRARSLWAQQGKGFRAGCKHTSKTSSFASTHVGSQAPQPPVTARIQMHASCWNCFTT